MIAHLRGREAALEPLGWTGRQAEWIELVCLHGAGFDVAFDVLLTWFSGLWSRARDSPAPLPPTSLIGT